MKDETLYYDTIKDIAKDVKNIYKTINGGNGSDGLVVKVDRNTQFRQKHQTFWGRAWPSLVVLLVMTAVNYFIR